jgi:hypothetical protein
MRIFLPALFLQGCMYAGEGSSLPGVGLEGEGASRPWLGGGDTSRLSPTVAAHKARRLPGPPPQKGRCWEATPEPVDCRWFLKRPPLESRRG